MRRASLLTALAASLIVLGAPLAWGRGGGGHGGGGHSFSFGGGHSSSSFGHSSSSSHTESGLSTHSYSAPHSYTPHSSTSSLHGSTGTVHVHGYTRKDGTRVEAYTRSAPHEHVSSGARESTAHTGTAHTGASGEKHATATVHASPGVAHDAQGHEKRSAAARDAFMRSHPCPSTGRSSGACSGYVVDHVVALKHGGADAPTNMQWQTVDQAKAKDKWE